MKGAFVNTMKNKKKITNTPEIMYFLTSLSPSEQTVNLKACPLFPITSPGLIKDIPSS